MVHLHLRAAPGVLLTGAAMLFAAQVAPSTLSAQAVVPVADSAVAVTPDAALTEHVVVISIDGLRPDAIAKYDARTMERLMREGSYTLDAKTILPSTTLPSHTSMLTGVEPGTHGITWDHNETDTHGTVSVPTIFAEAHQQGLKTAAFFSKGKFEHLEVPNSLDHADAPTGDEKWPAEKTVANVREYLSTEKPNLMFVHFGEPDYAGHKFSWMSWFYGRAVRRADQAVGEVLAAADLAFGKGQYTLILTADHGGHGWSHGSSDARDVTIPWIAWGEGVRPGVVLEKEVRTMDTAATALWLLNVPAQGIGLPVQTAFAPAVVPALAVVGASAPSDGAAAH